MTTTLPSRPGLVQIFRGFGVIAWVAVGIVGWAAACRAADPWLTSYDEALAAAERTGRPILTIFTGSDWCSHCHHLEEKVLHTETFSRWAEDKVVLLLIDLPQQGISQQERQSRSRVCVKYGVRSFPSALLIGPDGGKIALQAGYTGQSAEAWVAAMGGHLPDIAGPTAPGQDVISSLDEAVETARDAKRPILLMVSRSGDAEASTRVASLIKDPEFESLARDHFVVATVPSQAADAIGEAGRTDGLDGLLGGTAVPADAVELIVTDDGKTPLYTESGAQPPHRIVTGLRRFLAARQTVRR